MDELSEFFFCLSLTSSSDKAVTHGDAFLLLGCDVITLLCDDDDVVDVLHVDDVYAVLQRDAFSAPAWVECDVLHTYCMLGLQKGYYYLLYNCITIAISIIIKVNHFSCWRGFRMKKI